MKALKTLIILVLFSNFMISCTVEELTEGTEASVIETNTTDTDKTESETTEPDTTDINNMHDTGETEDQVDETEKG